MKKIATEVWKEDLAEFREKTDAFYAGELDKSAYKGFSGGYGSYAQRGGNASMVRLRMAGGRLTKDKLKFVADSIAKHNIDRVHLTTCARLWHCDARRRRRLPKERHGFPAFRGGKRGIF